MLIFVNFVNLFYKKIFSSTPIQQLPISLKKKKLNQLKNFNFLKKLYKKKLYLSIAIPLLKLDPVLSYFSQFNLLILLVSQYQTNTFLILNALDISFLSPFQKLSGLLFPLISSAYAYH